MVDLFQPYQTWEKFSNPSKQCPGLVNPLTETQSLALAAGQTLGCLGIPFFSLKQDWTILWNAFLFSFGKNTVVSVSRQKKMLLSYLVQEYSL